MNLRFQRKVSLNWACRGSSGDERDTRDRTDFGPRAGRCLRQGERGGGFQPLERGGVTFIDMTINFRWYERRAKPASTITATGEMGPPRSVPQTSVADGCTCDRGQGWRGEGGVAAWTKNGRVLRRPRAQLLRCSELILFVSLPSGRVMTRRSQRLARVIGKHDPEDGCRHGRQCAHFLVNPPFPLPQYVGASRMASRVGAHNLP